MNLETLFRVLWPSGFGMEVPVIAVAVGHLGNKLGAVHVDASRTAKLIKKQIKSIVIKSVAAVTIAVLLSACSTTIIPTLPIPAATSGTLRITGVNVTTAAGVTAPADINARLEQAVQNAVATKNPNGSVPTRLNISVTRYEVVSNLIRFLAGGFVGSDKLYVQVDVLDARTGAVIGKFEVQRTSNTGMKGAVIDDEQAVIDSAAEGVAEGIFGVSSK